MAGDSSSRGVLHVLLGALIAVVVGFAVYHFGGFGQDEADIKIELPDIKN